MTQRRQEFGVRLALGAEPRHVRQIALQHGLVLAGVGIAAGVAGAVALTRYLTAMLAGVTPLDPTTYVAVALGFATMALLAAFVPARQATRVDPVIALRYE
jgi:ABC-type antimicrobial peptide transport system permease subunit